MFRKCLLLADPRASLIPSSLKYEDIIPDIELKQKIDAWVAGGATEPADDVMDVDQL